MHKSLSAATSTAVKSATLLSLSLLLLAGCVTPATAPSSTAHSATTDDAVAQRYTQFVAGYPDLTSLARMFVTKELNQNQIDDQQMVVCDVTSFLTGIPEADLALMDDAIREHRRTPERQAAFKRWLDPGFTHGSINDETYKDGTPRDYEAEKALTTRVRANAHTFCPDSLAKFPAAFSY